MLKFTYFYTTFYYSYELKGECNVRFFVNFEDTCLETHYHNSRNSVSILVRDADFSKKYEIEIFGLGRNYKKCFLLDDYQIVKMSDNYIGIDKCAIKNPKEDSLLFVLWLPSKKSNCEWVLLPSSKRHSILNKALLGEFHFNVSNVCDSLISIKYIYFLCFDMNKESSFTIYSGYNKRFKKLTDVKDNIYYSSSTVFSFDKESNSISVDKIFEENDVDGRFMEVKNFNVPNSPIIKLKKSEARFKVK